MKFRLLLGGCLLVNALTLQANERWFEVEMIIFERTGDSTLKEHFPTQVTPIRLGRHIDLLTEKFYIPLPVDPDCQTPDAVDAAGIPITGEAEPAADCMPQPIEQTPLAGDSTDALLAGVLEPAPINTGRNNCRKRSLGKDCISRSPIWLTKTPFSLMR